MDDLLSGRTQVLERHWIVDGNWIECVFDLSVIGLRGVGQGAEPI
jgi:hypothetical protein